MIIRKLTTFTVLLCSLCSAVRGQVQSPAPGNTDQPTLGTISGKIVNESGQPLAGAAVIVRGLNSGGSGRTTTTDTEGSFSVGNLEPRLYTVVALAPAYTSNVTDPIQPTYYRIGDSVRMELIRGGVITGTVTNAAGEPVVGVRVRGTMVRDAKGQAPRLSAFTLVEQPTDDRGVYRLFGLLPGTYLVSAGGLGLGQTFQFDPYDSNISTYAPSSTRDTAAEVSVTSGEEAAVDIRYRSEPGYVISGSVKVSGMNGSSITLTSVGSSSMPLVNGFQPPGARGFSFSGLTDGEYDLVAHEFSGTPTSLVPVMMVSEPKRVSVKGASVTGIELVPKPVASISGKIVLEPSKAPACQGKRQPMLAEMAVQSRRPEKEADKEPSTYTRVFGSLGSPDTKGAFVIHNVTPGKYQFDPNFHARYWYLQSITIGSAAAAKSASTKVDAAANWTVVKFGDQLSNLTITLAEGAASVRGRLSVGDGVSPAGMLYLIPAEPDKAEDVLRFFVTDFQADATFSFNNLPPGRYKVVMQPAADPQIATLTRLRLPESAPARAKFRRAGDTQKTEIELKPCQNLNDYELALP
jgi:hypothetical protein